VGGGAVFEVSEEEEGRRRLNEEAETATALVSL